MQQKQIIDSLLKDLTDTCKIIGSQEKFLKIRMPSDFIDYWPKGKLEENSLNSKLIEALITKVEAGEKLSSSERANFYTLYSYIAPVAVLDSFRVNGINYKELYTQRGVTISQLADEVLDVSIKLKNGRKRVEDIKESLKNELGKTESAIEPSKKIIEPTKTEAVNAPSNRTNDFNSSNIFISGAVMAFGINWVANTVFPNASTYLPPVVVISCALATAYNAYTRNTANTEQNMVRR